MAKFSLFDKINDDMRKNNLFFRILFAIELALLPLVFFAWYFMPTWSMGIFIAGILLVKIWMELFKDKISAVDTIINSVGNVVVYSTLIIFFMCINAINIALGVVSLVLIWLANIFSVLLAKKTLPEGIEAVDFCFMLFGLLTLIAFTFVVFYNLIATIGLIAIILTAVVSVGYKVVYIIKRSNLFKSKK